MTDRPQQRARALAFIAACTDPKQLEQMVRNARRQNDAEIARAAELRLYKVMPAARQGTLEHDVWQSIHALEGSLTAERGKTTRLARTRQKIGRDGEQRTVADLVSGKPADGFTMLIERDMPELTFEAVALRHRDRFDAETLSAAEKRLAAHGYQPPALRN
ncbi:MAG TPA: hypothetical protein VD887_04940 [Allosphingosinicella sp.]|nr:hypothetical protein [Allosphingosinicella sp.]